MFRMRALKGLTLGHGRHVPQPVPDVTLNDVERIVRREFPGEEFASVMGLLNEYGKESDENARVLLAVLKLAGGRVEKLSACLESAKRDYRDVLVAAEYPGSFKTGFGVREIPAKDRDRIVASDWRQYQEWLRK